LEKHVKFYQYQIERKGTLRRKPEFSGRISNIFYLKYIFEYGECIFG